MPKPPKTKSELKAQGVPVDEIMSDCFKNRNAKTKKWKHPKYKHWRVLGENHVEGRDQELYFESEADLEDYINGG